jgi:hypothetical protein
MRVISGAVVCLFAAGIIHPQAPAPTPNCPPHARIDPAKETYGTTVVANPYRWLEDQESPETRARIESEQKCTEAALSKVGGRAVISARLEQFYHRDAYEAPLERGGRYFYLKRVAGGADVNLRGGGEFGEAWHHAGMFEKKQTVFDDFFAAAEFLIAQKYTSTPKLAILGGSNGGLLMGASITQRPELFRAVVCSYPLLDMLRYQKFLEGPYWVPEYGSAENPEQFKYLYAYSPYHRVLDGTKFPATLFVTGDGDTRVAPLHARKMAARLQAANGSNNPILLLYDTKSGHSGGRPIKKTIEEYTDILSFLFWQLNVPQPLESKAAVTGTWRGQSTCEIKASACRDELNIYGISDIPEKSGRVAVTGSKIVDGHEVVMGTLEWSYDAQKHALQSPDGAFQLTLNDDHLEGTLTRDNAVFRRIFLTKQN